MAIEQAGSTLRLTGSNANSGTVSSTITVPADATKVIVGVVEDPSGLTAPFEAMTFTKGGVDTAMTKVPGGDDDGGMWGGTMFWMDDPDTGTNKTLKWDWQGTGTFNPNGMLVSITFWKGCADGVRDSDGDQLGGLPWTSPTLTCQSGDKIVAWACATSAPDGSVSTWTNLTTLSTVAVDNIADGEWGTGDPSGDTTVAVATVTNWDPGGAILAAVLMPEAAADVIVAWIRA